MKLKTEHFDAIVKAFGTIATARVRAVRTAILEEGKAKDVEKRLRWDLLHHTLGSGWVCREVYPYANDDHLDTALKAAMRKAGHALTGEAAKKAAHHG